MHGPTTCVILCSDTSPCLNLELSTQPATGDANPQNMGSRPPPSSPTMPLQALQALSSQPPPGQSLTPACPPAVPAAQGDPSGWTVSCSLPWAGGGARSPAHTQNQFLSNRYVGELISDAEADVREDDSYLFDLDNKVGRQHLCPHYQRLLPGATWDIWVERLGVTEGKGAGQVGRGGY